jgi:hypothetical protein
MEYSMKTLLRIALALTTIYVPSAFAGSGWVNVTISSLGSHQENGGEYVLLIDRVINTEGGAQNVAELRWKDSAPNSKGIYSTLLTAVAAGHPVLVYVYSCTASGWPQLWGAKIIP